jgi:hypothetical protein
LGFLVCEGSGNVVAMVEGKGVVGFICVCVCVCICMYVYVFIYIYIYIFSHHTYESVYVVGLYM